MSSTRTQVQRYLTKYQRWNSPKFIIGESYGTTRAAGLVDSLLNSGVQVNGVTFMSTVFNFADFQGDQSAVNFMPTYAGVTPGTTARSRESRRSRNSCEQARDFASGPICGSACRRGTRSPPKPRSRRWRSGCRS